MAEGKSVELRQITAGLRGLRDRLGKIAGRLGRLGAAGTAEARRAVAEAQSEMAEVAAELIRANAQLQRLAGESGAAPGGPSDADMARHHKAAEELRAVIECVIVDRLVPAIQALVESYLPSSRCD